MSSETGTSGSTSTAVETAVHGANAATFTEFLGDSGSVVESGNGGAGYYTLTQAGTRTAGFADRGTTGGNTFGVAESSHGSYTDATVG